MEFARQVIYQGSPAEGGAHRGKLSCHAGLMASATPIGMVEQTWSLRAAACSERAGPLYLCHHQAVDVGGSPLGHGCSFQLR